MVVEEWRLIDLGPQEPYMAQCFYEAVAICVDKGTSPSTLIITQPSSPYVCIGYHQRLEEEIDMDYCRSRGLPIIRRGQGGGACYLDSNQVFYQLVAHEDSPVVPTDVEELFRKCLSATVYVYRSLGVPAEYKPINDVVVRGKKISGNGAGRLGKAIILVGNIILDWDFDSLVHVLRVPDEKFRDKMAKSMREWLTSLRQELGYVPPVERIKELMAEGFEKALGIRLVKGQPTEEEVRVYKEVVLPKHKSREWLYLPEERHPWAQPGRVVKIADGVRVVSIAHKAKKMIRLTAEVMGDQVLDVIIAGDFFAVPSEAIKELEESLRGCRLAEEELRERIEGFYKRTGVRTPGMGPEDFLRAFLKLREAVEAYLPSIRPSTGEEQGQ
ncbi:MAG TPA: hypothetical protein ENF78_04325 [Candidatus Bathyarchaeota archaeon]|nr:hypothetical protein [Candidatus Bathyarchaeota archaeon]